MKTGKLVHCYLFVTAPILESYVRMCTASLPIVLQLRLMVPLNIDNILVWVVNI